MELQAEKIKFLSPLAECFVAEDYYKFAKIDHFWIKWRFDILQKIIPNNYVWGQTLDIGCGNGVIKEQVDKYYGIEVCGCDLNLSALRMASCGRGQLYFYNIHQRRNEFREFFSTILLMDVLEHIRDSSSFIKSIGFHLRPGGKLIINVPARQWLYSRYDSVQGHVKRYSIACLRNELSLGGFSIENFTYWGFSLIPILLLRKLLMYFCQEKDTIKLGFQPNSSGVNSLFKFLRCAENKILQQPITGTSLMAVARKENI